MSTKPMINPSRDQTPPTARPEDAATVSTSDLSAMTTIVVGASRGLGRGISTAVAEAGAPVIAVARTPADLAGAANIRRHVADAGDPTVAGSLLDRYEPRAVILVAGATPLLRSLQHHTWETFSINWHTDVRISFHWVREALLKPLPPGSRVIVISSGAALQGSPLSGGYAGAKATQRFITAYAQDEATRAGLGITFTAVLPRLTPLTDLGRPAVRAYAARSGQTEEQYLQRFGDSLTPELAGAALVELLRTDATAVAPAYLLTGDGLRTLPT
jgi:NAD(P)-dependent dehydrogenase (short-subunit alcohol dehydrogenase family)